MSAALARIRQTERTTSATSTIALMYHAIDARGASAAGEKIDRHYAIGRGALAAQLERCRKFGPLVSARDWLAGRDGTMITFDDGDASHYRTALPVLLDHAVHADFFVNPGTVGQRGFVDWSQLREMASLGMSIQSHGFQHCHFTLLPRRQLRDELIRARLQIEDELGAPVTLLAPPGGRMPAGMIELARDCGYRHVLCSRPGRVRRDGAHVPLPRIAVTAGVSPNTLGDWLTGRGIVRLKARYHALGLAKAVLGDGLYERVRRQRLAYTASRPC
jgi:peptidoglycan/xylan/chitin deacetylase (PgdA/CDA1 family)